jgi:hypothetical protein
VSCLGLGFMFLEIALIQRLMLYLGNPTYALTVVLFVLLIFGGIGSRAFAWRVANGSSRELVVAVLVALIAYATFLGFCLSAIFNETLAWVPLGRAALAALVMAPMGFLLGIPFPTGISVVAQRAGTRIPWLWSVNSATSVLGSVLATVTSLHVGISVSLAVGIAFYGFATMLWFKIRLVEKV